MKHIVICLVLMYFLAGCMSKPVCIPKTELQSIPKDYTTFDLVSVEYLEFLYTRYSKMTDGILQTNWSLRENPEAQKRYLKQVLKHMETDNWLATERWKTYSQNQTESDVMFWVVDRSDEPPRYGVEIFRNCSDKNPIFEFYFPPSGSEALGVTP